MCDQAVYRKGKWEYFLDGKAVSQRTYEKRYPPVERTGGRNLMTQSTTAYPKTSDGMAVHPNQREEAMADAKAKGVDTFFNEQGQPVFTSRLHQKQYIARYGFHNNDGGFGD